MEKIKIIKLPARKETYIKKTVYVCDICNQESQNTLLRCYLCERHICSRYSKNGCFKFDSDDYISDYPNKYCNHCYKLKFEKYRKEYLDIKDEYNKKLDMLEQKIKQESLKLGK